MAKTSEVLGFWVHKRLRWSESEVAGKIWSLIHKLPDNEWESIINDAMKEAHIEDVEVKE